MEARAQSGMVAQTTSPGVTAVTAWSPDGRRLIGLMAALEPTDYLFTNYREHGYALAKGIEPGRVIDQD